MSGIAWPDSTAECCDTHLIFVRASVPDTSSAALSFAAAGLPSCTSAFSGMLCCSHTDLRT